MEMRGLGYNRCRWCGCHIERAQAGVAPCNSSSSSLARSAVSQQLGHSPPQISPLRTTVPGATTAPAATIAPGSTYGIQSDGSKTYRWAACSVADCAMRTAGAGKAQKWAGQGYTSTPPSRQAAVASGSAAAHHGALQQRGAHAHERAVAHGAAVQAGLVAYRHLPANHSVGGMTGQVGGSRANHAAVLQSKGAGGEGRSSGH